MEQAQCSQVTLCRAALRGRTAPVARAVVVRRARTIASAACERYLEPTSVASFTIRLLCRSNYRTGMSVRSSAVSPGAPPSAVPRPGGRGRRLQLHDACTFRGFRLTLPYTAQRDIQVTTLHCTAYTYTHIHILLEIPLGPHTSSHLRTRDTMHRTTSSPPQRTCGVRDMAAPGARNAVCAHSSFSRLAVKSHHVEVAGTGHKSSCTHRSRFAGGLRSLADSRPEKASYYPRQQNTSLFQSVHPRSALVAQCRLRWFVNPACREANC